LLRTRQDGKLTAMSNSRSQRRLDAASLDDVARGSPKHAEPPSAADPPWSIPDGLNICLTCAVVAIALALLWLGSQVTAGYAVLGVGVVFSYMMLTNYALLHEATHDNLHSNPRVNHLLGFVAGALFPAPFSMIHYTHRSHHRFNRTDREMFDLYYPTDNRVLKYVQWYCILGGLFWPLVPLGAILIAFCPSVFRSRLFASASPARGLYYVARIPQATIRAARIETLLIILVFAGLYWLLELRWTSTLVLYACFSFNWSTRQYITHAYSPRDVTDGAFNLRHNRLMSWLLLHGEWDRNHHRRPDVSWYYLPRLSTPDEPRISYIRQYWRQWRGPVPATEPAPQPLEETALH
jgi:fatty acid desaturase